MRYCAQGRRALGIDREILSVEDGAAPAAVLERLAALHGAGVGRMFLDANGRAQPSVLLFVDGEQVSVHSTQALKHNDELEILLPMSGG
ncbi:MAG: MoaD/ThiS family protein [Planctomycetota bacterium]